MTNRKLSSIILFAGDMTKMTDFYSGVLGLPIIDDEDSGFVVLDAGGCQLCLHRIPPEYTDSCSEPREDSYTKIVFHSDDIEADRDSLLSKDVRMKETVLWKDMAFCDGFDPEGNVFQISGRSRAPNAEL